MMKEQVMPAFIAALVKDQNVAPETIEAAVDKVLDKQPERYKERGY